MVIKCERTLQTLGASIYVTQRGFEHQRHNKDNLSRKDSDRALNQWTKEAIRDTSKLLKWWNNRWLSSAEAERLEQEN